MFNKIFFLKGNRKKITFIALIHQEFEENSGTVMTH